MQPKEITNYRLVNQQISQTSFTSPRQIVEWMAAMQAQEYAMAKWAIGLRLPGVTDENVESAFNSGEILRTHIMRPTWHFVSPKDIRWMIMLTSPRVHQTNAFTYRQMELDKPLLVKCAKILEKALQDGKSLTREILKTELEKNNIHADGIRLSAIMMYAELEAVICSGPRQGKQFTYALLEERAAPAKKISYDEALIKLTDQYFRSRGPATLQDFTTWSGLTVKDAKTGIANLSDHFVHEHTDDKTYIYIPAEYKEPKSIQKCFLMPDYDEYGMSYKDRSAIFNPANKGKIISRDNPIFNRMIIIDSRIEGTWTRTVKGNDVYVETYPFRTLNKNHNDLLNNAIKKYSAFVKNSRT